MHYDWRSAARFPAERVDRVSRLKNLVKRQSKLLACYHYLRRVLLRNLTAGSPWCVIGGCVRFLSDLRQYRRLGGEVSLRDLRPCLFDKTAVTPLDVYYFYQDTTSFLPNLRNWM